MVFLRVLALFLLGVASLAAAGNARDRAMVVAAQRILGPGLPSWRIEIKNRRVGGPYEATTQALVFAWRDGLWFYCPADGTQSLSRFRGRVERDRADLLPLLQRIGPGFAAYRELPADASGERALAPSNICFIESLAFARGLAAAEPRALRADVVSYYLEDGGRLHGHSVVWFTTGEGDFVFDGEGAPRVQRVRLGADGTATDFARAVLDGAQRGRLARVTPLPVELGVAGDTALAADRPRKATDSESRTVIR